MHRASPLAREAALSALGAATLAALLAWLGPPGTDLAAHAYQRALFLQHGFELWNNFWYAGRYSFVTYSLLYYPLAAALGIRLLAVVTIGVAAYAFSVVVGREWGATASSGGSSRARAGSRSPGRSWPPSARSACSGRRSPGASSGRVCCGSCSSSTSLPRSSPMRCRRAWERTSRGCGWPRSRLPCC